MCAKQAVASRMNGLQKSMALLAIIMPRGIVSNYYYSTFEAGLLIMRKKYFKALEINETLGIDLECGCCLFMATTKLTFLSCFVVEPRE